MDIVCRWTIRLQAREVTAAGAAVVQHFGAVVLSPPCTGGHLDLIVGQMRALPTRGCTAHRDAVPVTVPCDLDIGQLVYVKNQHAVGVSHDSPPLLSILYHNLWAMVKSSA